MAGLSSWVALRSIETSGLVHFMSSVRSMFDDARRNDHPRGNLLGVAVERDCPTACAEAEGEILTRNLDQVGLGVLTAPRRAAAVAPRRRKDGPHYRLSVLMPPDRRYLHHVVEQRSVHLLEPVR